jgi:hypothetical protein
MPVPRRDLRRSLPDIPILASFRAQANLTRRRLFTYFIDLPDPDLRRKRAQTAYLRGIDTVEAA